MQTKSDTEEESDIPSEVENGDSGSHTTATSRTADDSNSQSFFSEEESNAHSKQEAKLPKARQKLVKKAGSISEQKHLPKPSASPYEPAGRQSTRLFQPTSTQKTAREYWLRYVKRGQGFSGHITSTGHLKAQSTTALLHNGKRSSTAIRSTTDYLKAWMQPSDATSRNSQDKRAESRACRPASAYTRTRPTTPLGTSNVHLGLTDINSVEDYSDQILDLKKVLIALEAENTILKTKVRKFEDEVQKKEKTIHELLTSSKEGDLSVGVDAKGNSTLIVKSLKQRIFKLERAVKEKESALEKVQSDLKTTKAEELKVQLGVYYDEIIRLRNSAKQRETNGDSQSSATQSQLHDAANKLKVLSTTIKIMSEEKARMQEENRSIKQELERELSARGKEDKASKAELMMTIRRLEKKLKKAENDVNNAAQTNKLKKEEEENEKLVQILTKLKEDRLRYREELHVKSDKIRTLKQEIADLQTDLKCEREKQKTLAERLAETQLNKPSPSPTDTHREGLRRASAHHSAGNRQNSHSLHNSHSKKRRSITGKLIDSAPLHHGHKRKHTAASTIQRKWRQHHREKEQHSATSHVQQALRTHLFCKSSIKQAQGKQESIQQLQTLLRAHTQRKKIYISELKGKSMRREMESKHGTQTTSHRKHQTRLLHSQSDDDDVIVS